jgi:hypothetical protein
MLSLSTSPFGRVARNRTETPRSGKSRRPLPAHRPSRKYAAPGLRVGPQTLSRECYGVSLFTSGAHYALVAELSTQP